MTNAAALAAQLDKFAASDLRKARKEGEILVAGTVRGTLFLSCVAGVYSLSTAGLEAVVLASGKPAAVRPVLAALYSVSEA